MQTVFFPLSEYPQGVPESARYRVSVDRESLAILDVTLIGPPREVRAAEEEGGEEKLTGWEADMDYLSCADPCAWETCKASFDALAARMPYPEASEAAERAAWERVLPTPVPEPTKVYSKLKIYEHAATLGIWAALEAWMRATTTSGGVNAYEAFSAAQVIQSDYPQFDEAVAAVAEAVGKSEEEVREILEDCLADDAEIAASDGK